MIVIDWGSPILSAPILNFLFHISDYILTMIHSGPLPKTRVTWGFNAVVGREAANSVLASVVVVYVVLTPSTAWPFHSWGRGPIKRIIKK